MRILGITILAATILATAAHGQGAVPVSGEVQINTYTTGGQTFPEIVTLADGRLVVVWGGGGSNGSDTSGSSIQGRMLAVDGTATGEDFQINTVTTGYQRAPAIAALGDGGFVTVWTSSASSGSDVSSTSVQGRRFASDGIPAGGDFQVNTFTDDTQRSGSVAGLPDGGFVTVWSSRGSSGTDSSQDSIQGQRFASDGTPAGGEFQINTYTLEDQFSPQVTALADGGFQVVWGSEGSNGSDTHVESIQSRRYGPDGTAEGDQFQVNTWTTSDQWSPTVTTLTDGAVVAMWHSHGSSGTDSGSRSVQGQRFATDGTRLGGEFQVNTYTAHGQGYPSVAAAADGGFVAVWVSSETVGLGSLRQSIQGQRFAADGERLTGEFQITSEIVDRQEYAAVTSLVDGSLMAVWSSVIPAFSNPSWYDIRSRRYTLPRFAVTGLSGKCLDVEGGAGAADGTPVNLFACHGGDNQSWQLELTSGVQRIRGLDGKCLIPGPIESDGDIPAVIGECGDGDDLWRLVTSDSTGYHAQPSLLIHGATGLCLDVAGGSHVDGTPTLLFDCHGGANQLWRPAAEVCTPDALGLCLEQERFRADLSWRSFDGTTGSGKAVLRSSDDSGLLWFFETDNWEMLIKVLDGCAINDRFWVFAAATTTVEYTLTVTDTVTGSIVEYFNPLGNAADAITDTEAFGGCSASSSSAPSGSAAGSGASPVGSLIQPPTSGETMLAGERPSVEPILKGICEPSPTRLCLADGRFGVEVDWRDYAGNVGSGQPVSYSSGTRDASGLFWFFTDNNWEMLVKVLDACAINGRLWMLAAATTDVEYTLRVTDHDTGVSREYFNPLGNAAAAIVDTFESCP